jgi:hypothetical protein
VSGVDIFRVHSAKWRLEERGDEDSLDQLMTVLNCYVRLKADRDGHGPMGYILRRLSSILLVSK